MPESLMRARSPRQAWQSRTSWGVELGGLRLAVTRTDEQRPLGPVVWPPAPPRRAPFVAGALAGVGAVALLVVGASAAPRPALPGHYLVSVPVPAPARVARPRPRAAVGQSTKPKAAMVPLAAMAGDRLDAADEPHVARAMATGSLQEWEDQWGQRRFLTAGPARVAGGRACRDLALLIRLAEGGSHVRSIERCTAATALAAPPGDGQPADVGS